MILFLDALSDAWGQMMGTLSYVAQAFGENWRTGLAALLDRPTALIYVVGFVAVLVLTCSVLTLGSRVGYRRDRFLSANEKSFLRTLDAALGRAGHSASRRASPLIKPPDFRVRGGRAARFKPGPRPTVLAPARAGPARG